MAKRIKFEEIAKAKFRWPQKGDVAFRPSDTWSKNTYIAHDKLARLVVMIDGYKMAADLAVKQATSERHDRDFLVYPIIFNYRQFIELWLKYLIFSYGPTVDIKADWNTHDLEKLWGKFTNVLKEYGTEDPDSADEHLTEIIAQFSKIDSGSYSFRYPVDKKGNAIPVEQEHLDLEVLADVMNAVENYFSGCDGYLDSLMQGAE